MGCEGVIQKALSGFYYVNTGRELLTCRARGRFRKEGVTPLVGDRVEVRELGNGEGFVEAILPRKNDFTRPAVANIDQLVVIASGAIPKTDPFLIDRVAAIAALKGCGVVVVLNKCDLDSADDLYGIYQIQEDGKVIASGRLDDLKLGAQESKEITIDYQPESPLPGAEYFINFSFRQKHDTRWAKAGYEVASEQFALGATERPVFQPQGEAARIRKDRPVYDSCRQFEKVGGNHGAGNCRLHDIHRPGLSHGIVIQNKPFYVCGAFHHMRRYHLSRPSAQADKGSEIIRRIDRIRLEMVDVVLRRTILKHQYRVLNQLYGIATHDFWQGKTRRSGKRNGLVRTHIFQPCTVNHPTLAT